MKSEKKINWRTTEWWGNVSEELKEDARRESGTKMNNEVYHREVKTDNLADNQN